MMDSVAVRLAALGFAYAPAPRMHPKYSFVCAKRAGNLVVASGQVSTYQDEHISGKVGADVSLDQAIRAAEICAFNSLCAIGRLVKFDDIAQVVEVVGFVNAAPGFVDIPEVIEGASQLLLSVLAPKGEHARTALGVIVPKDFAVELKVTVEVK